MSRNIDQIFIANPITTNASTDLMYFGQSPYGITNDAAMTYANFAAQFAAPYTPAALTETNDTNVTLTLAGTPGSALLKAVSMTLGWTGVLSGTRGGTGVNNGVNTITLGGSLTTSGAFASTFTMTGATNVTFPTSGTLATTSSIPTPAALTEVNDTNITLTLGGSPSVALLAATSITAGWAGTLSGVRGGTGVNNGASTITLGGSLATVGAFSSTFTMSGITTVTFPTSGTLATTSQLPTLPLTAANGGSGVASPTAHGVLIAEGVSAFNPIVLGAGQVLIGTTAGDPSAASISSSTGVTVTSSTGAISVGLASIANNDVLANISGGSAAPIANTLTAVIDSAIGSTQGDILYRNATSWVILAPGTSGYVLATGGASANPSWVAQSGGGSGITYNDVPGTSVTAVANNGYIISNASQTTVTLPATIAEGSFIAVVGKGAGGWILQTSSGQIINFGSSPTSSGGLLTSSNQWDAVSIVCVTANTTFTVVSSIGNISYA